MQRRSILLSLALIGTLTGCASVSGGGTPSPAPSAGEATDAPTTESAAQARAQSWLDAAVLPPGAVASSTSPSTTVSFSNQYYAWPCTPVVELTAYWTIEGQGVTETANWLMANPTADLIVPVQMAFPEDTDVDMASVGNVPAADAQEGIVYTVAKMSSGVAVRAEIADMTETATCSSLAPGEQLGGVGQG